MRAVVQRVAKARVLVENQNVGEIQKGLLVLLGVGSNDNDEDIDYLSEKIVNLRIFEDENEKMNLSLLDIKGEVLVVSQFTLYGDARKGRRPNFMEAALPEKAEKMYEKFAKKCEDYGITVRKGVFGACMQVELINDGPVTILLDSKKTF